jgi:hypothetical protein
MNDLGKPDAGAPHVRFDEEALETGGEPPPGWSYRASALLYPIAMGHTGRPADGTRGTKRGTRRA